MPDILFITNALMAIVNFILTNWLELFGTLSALVYLYFSIQQKIWLWPLGIVSSMVYILVYFEARLYSEMGLQAYYVIISIYGWWSWARGKSDEGSPLMINKLKLNQAIMLLLVTAFVFVAMGLLLKHFTNTDVPWADALATAFSITATYMLARKIIEQWLLWVLIDGYCMALYIYKGLNITAILFFVYAVMAIVGYREWNKQLKTQATCR